MKRATLFVLLTAATTIATPAFATTRPVQIVIDGSSSLAAKVNATDPSVNVNLEQDQTQGWSKPIAGPSTTALMFEVTANSDFNAIGLYNVSNATERFEILPPGADEGWFAVATFSGADILNVSIFDENSLPVATKPPFTGVQINNFGYYIENKGVGGGLGYTEDDKNGGTVRALVYRSEASPGAWWVCAF